MISKLKTPGTYVEERKDLSSPVRHLIKEIKSWQNTIEAPMVKSGIASKQKLNGFKILFYGKADSNKAKSVALVGKELNQAVYRVDLSQIISNYIEETEKNLSEIFESAEKENWILYFDEAETLFGKRTTVNSSHDRYANQEIAYLLGRILEYPGIIVLSTNFKKDIETAFMRRLRFLVNFPFPINK